MGFVKRKKRMDSFYFEFDKALGTVCPDILIRKHVIFIPTRCMQNRLEKFNRSVICNESK